MSYSLYKEDGLKELEKTSDRMSGEAKTIGQLMITNMKAYDAYHNKEMMKKDVEIAKLEGYIEGLKKSVPSKPDTDDMSCDCIGFQHDVECKHHVVGY